MSVTNLHYPLLAFDRALVETGEARDLFAFDKLSMRHFDKDGRLHVERANISKANVCPYFGREIVGYKELGLDENRIYKLYRDPQELAKAASTFNRLQLLLVHTGVNAANPKMGVTVGAIGSDVAFEYPYLTASLGVWTSEAISLIESKQQAQLSASYRYRADMTPGKTPDGVAFDGIMRDIMGNHVALVESGRAGPDVFVSDSNPSEFKTMYKRPLFVNAALAILGSPAITDEQKLALDAEMEKVCSAEDEAAAKKKKEDDEKIAKDKVPGPVDRSSGSANDIALAVDAALASKGYVTKSDADKLATDAANNAVARVNALHKAREDVKPLVGIVAMDSAEEVYAFALKQSGVKTEGVPAGAYGALVEQVKLGKSNAIVAPPSPKFASDAAISVAAAIPGLGRFAQA